MKTPKKETHAPKGYKRTAVDTPLFPLNPVYPTSKGTNSVEQAQQDFEIQAGKPKPDVASSQTKA